MTSPLSLRSICVYCGSSPGKDPAFMAAAETLGTALGRANIRLIYGGGGNGLMGAVARATIAAGGTVKGIIPEFLLAYEQADGIVGLETMEQVIVPDMHTRKQAMFEEADAFVAMPGGIGTLEELVEILTWGQLDRHKKPVALLSVKGFWAPYVELMEHMISSGFLHNPERVNPIVFEDANDVVPGLLAV